MIGALVWKEYREQRIAWVGLACVGAAAVFGLPFVMEQDPTYVAAHSPRAWLGMMVAVVAWAYGLICGAMTLAGERETKMLPFLDALPGLRRQIWLGKFLAAVLLVLALVAVLMAIAAAGGVFDSWAVAGLTLAATAGMGLFGLAWGMLFSALGKSVMNMILLALAAHVPMAFFAGLVSVLLAGLIAMVVGRPPPLEMGLICEGLITVLTILAALAISALVFTWPDRNRLRPAEAAPAPATARKGKPRVKWSMLFWLTWRQARGFAVGMAFFALFLGFVVLAQGLLLWPIATLLVGVLCGATAFADEQQGPFRFVGDQRLPLFKFWLVKVGVRALIAAVAGLILFLPSFTAAVTSSPHPTDSAFPFLTQIFHSNLVGTACPAELFLTLWLVHGFCAGCLCGVLFRNGLASGVMGIFLTTVMSAVWVPSLLEGGLSLWQALGAPSLLLLSTLPLLRPWAAGRVASWTTAGRLAPFALLALLWIAGGLAYRVWEIPKVPEKYDLNAFRASLPGPDENKGGELVRQAWFRFDQLYQSLQAEQADGLGRGLFRPEGPLQERAGDVVRHGWRGFDPELARRLDNLFAGDWAPMLKEAADLPPGMVEDLRNETVESQERSADVGLRMAFALAARGLQRQAAGDDEAFVENFHVGLSLARALRHHAPMYDVFVGRLIESVLCVGLDRWLEKLNGRPDLLRRALDLLSSYVDDDAADEADHPLVEYLIARNTLDYPIPWLEDYLSVSQTAHGRNEWAGPQEAQGVAATARLVPWEHQRQERLLRILFNGTGKEGYHLFPQTLRDGPLAMLRRLGQGYYYALGSHNPARQCRERAAQLELALRWYEADNGRPADKLDDLVPKYLMNLPADPYQRPEGPFHYRVSAGEKIVWPPDAEGAAPGAAMPPTREVAAGQGVLWSIGGDGQDDGGVRQVANENWPLRGEDVIFLVPQPPKGK